MSSARSSANKAICAKELFAVFSQDSLMERAFERSYEMLDITEKMYLEAKRVLRKSNEGDDVEITVKKPDGRIDTKKISGVKENVIFVNFDQESPKNNASKKVA